jgi:hyaluronan synthase
MLIGSLLIMILAIIGLYYFKDEMETIHQQRTETATGKLIFSTLFFIALAKIGFFVYNLILFLKYRPIETVSDQDLPLCTIVVPAYNEGHLVYFTLMSIAQSDYPKEKMELWAIDDGSTDETWYWINKAKEKLGNRLTIFKQEKNMGKKHALYKGFKTGKGEIFVTIDSDSIVHKDTLRNLVSPFVNDEKCGAVAGNVRVMNKNEGVIPRMLDVSFVFSFEFIRSAQSALGFVLCTPGALAAYRGNVLMKVADTWLNQTFAGRPASIGEDRALTNYILAEGCTVKFQKNSIVETNTPTDYKGLHKMYTRWGRSDVRETWMMNRFMFKNFRKDRKLGARFIFLHQWLRLITAIPAMALMFYFLFTHPILFLVSALSGVFFMAIIQSVFFTKYHNFKESMWSFPYGVLNLFTLFWITPYSIFTAKNSSWLTR